MASGDPSPPVPRRRRSWCRRPRPDDEIDLIASARMAPQASPSCGGSTGSMPPSRRIWRTSSREKLPLRALELQQSSARLAGWLIGHLLRSARSWPRGGAARLRSRHPGSHPVFPAGRAGVVFPHLGVRRVNSTPSSRNSQLVRRAAACETCCQPEPTRHPGAFFFILPSPCRGPAGPMRASPISLISLATGPRLVLPLATLPASADPRAWVDPPKVDLSKTDRPRPPARRRRHRSPSRRPRRPQARACGGSGPRRLPLPPPVPRG